MIARSLAPLQPLRGNEIEVIVADGGSRDGTRHVAYPLCDRFIDARRGRSRQMNAGAGAARGRVLLFLHAGYAASAKLVPDGVRRRRRPRPRS